jgi:pimeloyl-ACP methyl ester carboxylesterase
LTQRTLIVYVHGLWFTGREGFLLRRRLARALAAQTLAFSYPSVNATLAANAAALGRYLSALRAHTLHLVGHSLGGVVITRLFDDPPALPPGRVVVLGSPLNGSHAARGFARVPGAARLLGHSIRDVLDAAPRAWGGERELGVIAGVSPLGLGRLVARLEAPHDGTITVAETLLPGTTDRIEMPVNHSGMVFSEPVARQVVAFLRDGRFTR